MAEHEKTELHMALGSGYIIGSPNFWIEKRYRSYPGPPSELEQLAARLGIDDDELRLYLAEEIERRRSARPFEV